MLEEPVTNFIDQIHFNALSTQTVSFSISLFSQNLFLVFHSRGLHTLSTTEWSLP